MPIHRSPLSIMTGTLGLILFILPLAAPLIAQDAVQSVPDSIQCDFYNETCAKSEEGCNTPQYCRNPEQDSFFRCFVMWSNTSTNGVVVGLKGCMYHQPECNERCVDNQWVEGDSTDNVIFYCCCYGTNCNKEFFWEPKQVEQVETTPPTRIVKNTGVFHAVMLTLGLLILFFILAATLFYFYRKQKMANFIELPTVENPITHSQPFANLCSKPIQLLEIKAQGRFGAVWKATYCNNYIAVKIFPQQDHQSWLSEKKILSLPHMKHDNILHFIGADEKGDRPNKEYWLLTSYYDNGSLYDYLKGNVVTWNEMCRLGESIGRGLAFLHCESQNNNQSEGLKPAIAHRDFKSKNVLVKANLTACIADFGLALAFYPGVIPSEAHGQVGTRRYMAPEVLEGAICFQRDAFLPIDMYACALVLWEILTRCSAQEGPIPQYTLPFENEVGQHPTLDDMQDCVVTKKVRPFIDNAWIRHPGLQSVSQLITETWDHDAEARLSASCIVERFAHLSRLSYVSDSSYSYKDASY